MKNKETITITFGDCAENHKGMQMLGTLAASGFDHDDLLIASKWFVDRQIKTTVFSLPCPIQHQPAYLLVADTGVKAWCDPDALMQELTVLPWDQKALMYGRVVDKRARHNLCFDTDAQEPDYAKGKGRIISLSQVPLLSRLHDSLPISQKTKGLMIEGNRYYDNTCGIGFHGDSERRKVIGVRLGATIPLDFQWYYQGERIGNRHSFSLKHGDVYIMSEKAVGNDWKKKTIPILRHAAGAERFRI